MPRVDELGIDERCSSTKQSRSSASSYLYLGDFVGCCRGYYAEGCRRRTCCCEALGWPYAPGSGRGWRPAFVATNSFDVVNDGSCLSDRRAVRVRLRAPLPMV